MLPPWDDPPLADPPGGWSLDSGDPSEPLGAADPALERAPGAGGDQNFAELIPPDARDDERALGMQGKLPRRLHLWFALALGAVALLALGAQALLGAAVHAPAPASGPAAPAASPEPPIASLQRELAREKGELDPGPSGSFGQLPKLPGQLRPRQSGVAWAMAAGSPPAPVPAMPGPAPAADPGMDLPAGLLPAPAGVDDALPGAGPAYEQAKAQALVAGSRILALSHVGKLEGLAVDGAPGLAGHSAQLAELLQAAPELLHRMPELLAALAPVAARPDLSGADSRVPGHQGAGGAGDLPTGQDSPAALVLGPPARAPVILEGTPIAAVLLNEVRSDLPGMIVAQVAEDVFDSVTAQRRLIPRGTRLLGRYESQIGSGQQRLLATFHRMILPGGASIELQRMEAADAVGSAGLQDQVDTHFWQRFGQAFLTAGLARAAQRDGAAVVSTSGGGILPGPDASGQILVDTARTSLQQSSGLAPTLIIRRGSRFNVMVSRDLVLPELGTP